jgi:ribosome maturation factor RimP
MVLALEVGSGPLFCLSWCCAVEGAVETPDHGSRSVINRLQEIVSPILWSLGLELVEVLCVGQGSRSVVRVLIDKPGGVTISDCEQAHKALGPALDVADPFPHAYTLEVSSPGLDRPFKRLQDYQRAVGKRVNIKLRQPLEGQWRVAGELAHVDEQRVTLTRLTDRAEAQTLTLELPMIAEARLVVKI